MLMSVLVVFVNHYVIITLYGTIPFHTFAGTLPDGSVSPGGEGAVSAAEQHPVSPALLRVPVPVSRIDDAVRP